ncbi:hypothetical protein [Nocardioides ultimimeridianus]
MSDLNPVEAAIRDHVDTRYPEWHKRAEEPIESRSGARYRPYDVASLLAPALVAVGLFLFDNGYGPRLLVSASGRQFTRDSIRDMIAAALAAHPDGALRASVGGPTFWEHVYGRLPDYDGENEIQRVKPEATSTKTPGDYVREYRARQVENERASARAFLEAVRDKLPDGERVATTALYDAARANIGRKMTEAREGVGSWAVSDEDGPTWALPGKRLFYDVADDVLGARRRNGRGYFFVIRHVVRRLKEATVNVLLRATEVLGHGPRTAEEAEAFADAAVAEALALAPATRPESYDPRLLALPRSVLFALAEPGDHSRRMFATVATEHLRRNPDARPAIVEVARALRDGDPDGLVEEARAMCADALIEEASA